MKALIWKEVRENLLWALLLMLALGGAERYALHYVQWGDSVDLNFNDGVSLCKRMFLMVTLFGNAGAGLLLGFLQVLPELKRDRWAALLHRPVPAGQIYWGKAIAGLLLYFIAAGLPFLFSIWHAATPGNINAPFVPGLIQPGLADWFSGIAYYFAALCVSLQGGRLLWRALPFFAAVHISFASLATSLCRVAVEASVAMALVLVFAGWGAIQVRETLRGRPRISQLAFFVVAFYGACGVGDFLQMEGGLLGDKGDSKYSNWEVLDDGTPARLEYRNSMLMSVVDPDGKPFADPKYHADRVRSHALGMNFASSYIGDTHGWVRKTYPDFYRETSKYMYVQQAYYHPRLEQWFMIRKENEYYFAGVLPHDRAVFAQFGANGFVSPEARAQEFPKSEAVSMSNGDSLFIARGDSLLHARFSKRLVETLTLPESGPIYGMANGWARISSGSVYFKGVALRHAMAVFDLNGKLIATLPYSKDVDRWGQIAFGVLPSQDRFALHYSPSVWLPEKIRRTMPSYVDVLDTKGAVLASYTCAPLPRSFYSETWSDYFAYRLRSSFFYFGEMFYQRVGAALGSERLLEEWKNRWGTRTQYTWKIAGIRASLGLLAAILIYFWARRSLLPARAVWIWTVVGFLFGPAGLVVFWLTGERPTTVPCPACRRMRRIDAEHCVHCGAVWPPRETDAADILEEFTVPA